MLTLNTNFKANFGSTQYTNFEFNSFVKFGDKFLASKGDGIFELGSDYDDSVNIDAYFEPIESNYGSFNVKRMRYTYLNGRFSGDMILQISADESSFTPFSFSGSDLIPRRIRLPITRNIAGGYWKYRLSNVNGSDFSIDSAIGLFIIRNHGISQST